MEERYYHPDESRFISDRVDFESYFNDFGSMLLKEFPEIRSRHAKMFGLSADEVREFDASTKLLFPEDETDEILEDETAFKFIKRKPPAAALHKLNSLKHFTSRSSAHTKVLKKKLSYKGEVDLEEYISEEARSIDQMTDLVPCGFYLLAARLYSPARHSKYSLLHKGGDLQVNQEFLCLSCSNLDILRDRIACCNDFQPVDGDISENLTCRTELRAGDVHRSAMFYISNNFYIDARHSDNINYSTPIVRWGLREKLQFGELHKMETSTFADLRPLRLGYPYLYLHQGKCEHLLIFTDARLVHHRDPMDSTKYPLMFAFASLKGKFCFSCHVKTARYIVIDNDRLPEDAAYMCTACLMSYNYKSGQKIGNFKVYGYVGRSALL